MLLAKRQVFVLFKRNVLDNTQVFKSLPEEEKKYWHSHKYEVESGLLYLDVRPIVSSVISDHADTV